MPLTIDLNADLGEGVGDDDALLEVVEPKRRAVRLQREMSKAADGAAVTTKTDRRGRSRDRRTGWERRVAGIDEVDDPHA